ncbi:MAG: response regulator [Acidimicrobiales bacterium]
MSAGTYAQPKPQRFDTAARPRSAQDPVRVFLLDDHEIVRAGLRELLESAGGFEVVGDAGTAAEAVQQIVRLAPDVAVLDVRLPDSSGVDVCRELHTTMPAVSCLILSAYNDEEALIDAIMAGAAGFVLKQLRGGDLVNAIRRVAAGHSLLDPAVTTQVLDHIRSGTTRGDALDALSEQERRVLDFIGQGFTNRQIAQELALSEKSVKNSVSSLLSKLGMHRRTEAAAYVARAGERSRRRSQ